MPKIDFAEFSYYPSLRSTDGEHIGYRNLPNKDKDHLLPIFEISQHTDDVDFNNAIQLISTSAGKRPFILDFCREGMPQPTLPKQSKDPKAAKDLFDKAVVAHAQYMAARQSVLNPADGYANWRSIVADFPNAVPTIIFDKPSPQVLRQAVKLSSKYECLAIRITPTDDQKILSIVPQIAAVLDSPDQLLIIFDAGYSRTSNKGVDFAVNGITQISSELDMQGDLLRAVFMSSSFPHLQHVGLMTIENQDWAAWWEATQHFPFMFGDYAAMYRHKLRAVKPHGWRASVVLPLPLSWLAYRDSNSQDRDGWADGVEKIATNDYFKGAPDIWGTHAIKKAQGGNFDGLEWPRDWHGVKVNIHIHQQLEFAPHAPGYFDDSGDEP